MIWEWLVIPAFGAGIGWGTNLLAIRMLFRPKNPVRFPGNIVFQGLIPRRQDDIARAVADAVKNDLLPMDELLQKADIKKYEDEIVDAVVTHVDRRLDQNILGALPAQFRNAVAGCVQRIVAREVSSVVHTLSGRLTDRLRNDFDVGTIVQEKLESLNTEELEALVLKVARRELRMIEVLGAVLGFIIGLCQVGLLSLLKMM